MFGSFRNFGEDKCRVRYHALGVMANPIVGWVDASNSALFPFRAASHVSATGVVVRDMEGFVLGACSRFNRAISDSFAVEALACLQALHFARDMGF
ncbi:hypothetical protein Gotri_001426 [Gossypium trilobum]|uniref:RNase H type-1 domain-containing protein n=1 Tax=Gossypium trilobum TaxID=34281 RepID=A0A7J9FEM9_9ROSI|nr:hypothetical protein [Gossypium trilobum]